MKFDMKSSWHWKLLAEEGQLRLFELLNRSRIKDVSEHLILSGNLSPNLDHSGSITKYQMMERIFKTGFRLEGAFFLRSKEFGGLISTLLIPRGTIDYTWTVYFPDEIADRGDTFVHPSKIRQLPRTTHWYSPEVGFKIGDTQVNVLRDFEL